MDELIGNLTNDAIVKLQALWKQIGVPDEEIAEKLEKLNEKVSGLFRSIVALESETKSNIEAEIKQLSQTITNIASQLEDTTAVEEVGNLLFCFYLHLHLQAISHICYFYFCLLNSLNKHL